MDASGEPTDESTSHSTSHSTALLVIDEQQHPSVLRPARSLPARERVVEYLTEPDFDLVARGQLVESFQFGRTSLWPPAGRAVADRPRVDPDGTGGHAGASST